MCTNAYIACGGNSYGRVDVRQDSATGELFVLEVNSVCSIGINSYFDIGIAPLGLDFNAFLHGMVKAADHKAQVRDTVLRMIIPSF